MRWIIYFIYIPKRWRGTGSSPSFRDIYEINNSPHKNKIQRETDNNRTEDTDMWIKIYNNLIKHSQVKRRFQTYLLLLKRVLTALTIASHQSLCYLPLNLFDISLSIHYPWLFSLSSPPGYLRSQISFTYQKIVNSLHPLMMTQLHNSFIRACT